MLELTLTRHNELVDPSLHVWGWEIPVYLFLGGLVAGMMIIVGSLILQDRHRQARSVCRALPVIGLALLTLGMLALFLDLEHKLYVWRLYTTVQLASPMSWGAWILVLVYPALVAAILVAPPRFGGGICAPLDKAASRVAGDARMVRVIAGANIGLGVALGVYTGVLLSSLGARPFWNSAVLGVLFLVSGASAAAALAHLLSRDATEAAGLLRSDNLLLATELGLLALFLIGLVTASKPHADAARLVLGGPYTAVFWVGVVGFGLAIPLFLQSAPVRRRIHNSLVPPVFVLAGGLLLRWVVVVAGQASHWVSR